MPAMTLILLFSASYRWPSCTRVWRAAACVTAHSYGSDPLWERVASVAGALRGVATPPRHQRTVSCGH
eukprot:6500753-Prymnesium_polylepis.1